MLPVTLPYILRSRDAELDFSPAKPRARSNSPKPTSHIMAGRKTLLAPIHFIFSLLQKRSTVSIWLYEQLAFRIEGKIRVSSHSQKELDGPFVANPTL